MLDLITISDFSQRVGLPRRDVERAIRSARLQPRLRVDAICYFDAKESRLAVKAFTDTYRSPGSEPVIVGEHKEHEE